MTTLQARLNDPEYGYWVKAGICLQYTKEGLEDFVTNTCLQFHANVLANLTSSAITNPVHPVCGVKIKRQRLVTVCQDPYCQGFLNAVIQEGLDPNHVFTIRHGNLANSDVSLWHSHPYELAKLFMNQGQAAAQTGPAQTDLNGLMNFIDHCKIPSSQISSRRLIKEVSFIKSLVVSAYALPYVKRHSYSRKKLPETSRFYVNLKFQPFSRKLLTCLAVIRLFVISFFPFIFKDMILHVPEHCLILIPKMSLVVMILIYY